jgi:restriction endonuclease S subunit
MKYKSYPKYKDSGVEWLGDVPERWEVTKFGLCSDFQEGPGLRHWQFTDEGIKVICVTNITERGIDFSSYQKYISVEEYLSNYKHFKVNKGDLLLSSSGNSWGKLSVFNDDEIAILNTSTIRIFNDNSNKLNLLFTKWLIQSNPSIEQLGLFMTGSCQPNFGPSHLSRVIVPLPTIPEQQAISFFLDRETSRLDTLIEKKKKLIDLLKEKRTALISRVVTKGLPPEAARKAGLDPNPKMKPSGVEWLGDVPEQWDVKRLKCNFQLLTTKTENRTNAIALENIESWTGRFIATETEFEGDGVAFIKNDILFGKLRPYLAKVLKAENEGEAVGDFFVLRPEKTIDAEYASFYLRSKDFIDIIDGATFGSKMPRASWDFMGSIKTPLPPLPEQQAITSFLDRETAHIDTLISKVEQVITTLQEYRTALISAVITGKIDVRSAQ